MVWSVGTAVQVAVPIEICMPAPSSGMLLGSPFGRPKANEPAPGLAVQAAPFAPVASGVTAVGAPEPAYTQYLIRPGTPATGVSFVREANQYVAVVPLVLNPAATLPAATKLATAWLAGHPLAAGLPGP